MIMDDGGVWVHVTSWYLVWGNWRYQIIAFPMLGQYLRPKPKNISTPKSRLPLTKFVDTCTTPCIPPSPSSGTGLGTMDGFCHKDGEEEHFKLFDLSSEK